MAYPSSLDELTDGVPPAESASATALGDATYQHDDHHRALGTAVEAIEAELGLDPAGGSATVAARLDAADTTAAAKVAKSTLGAKGSLISASAASTPAEVAVGADGYVLTADSAQPAGVKWAAASGGVGAGVPVPSGGLSANQWALPPGLIASGVMAGAAWGKDVIWYIGFSVPAAITVTGGAVRTVTGAASSVARVAIVAADSTWQPSSLVYEFATFDTSATAVVAKTVSQALAAGRYLIAFKTEVGAPTLAYSPYYPTGGLSALINDVSAGGSPTPGVVVNTSAGAYANPPAAWSSLNGTAACPFFMRWTA